MDILNDAAIKTNAEVFKRKVRADMGVSGVVDKIEKVLQRYEHNLSSNPLTLSK